LICCEKDVFRKLNRPRAGPDDRETIAVEPLF
jgi:hypothetical protein